MSREDKDFYDRLKRIEIKLQMIGEIVIFFGTGALAWFVFHTLRDQRKQRPLQIWAGLATAVVYVVSVAYARHAFYR
jgi:drug/metabolite transporter (DMT)-like permease